MNPEAAFGLDQAPWPAFLVDNRGVIVRSNLAAVETFGTGLRGDAPRLGIIWAVENTLSSEQFLTQVFRPGYTALMLRFRPRNGPNIVCTAQACPCTDGERRLLLLQLFPVEGVDPRSATSDFAAHKQKLDCALQLARTVALDFNNALTSILGHTSLILGRMEAGHPWRSSLIEVEKSAARAAEIANDLGTFSRQEKEARAQSAGNLNALLRRTVEVFQQSPAAVPVEYTFDLENKLFAARFDEAKLQQAFVKLLENAVQSLKSGGRVTIHTRNAELSEAAQDRQVRLSPGAYVVAEIADTGIGIAPDILPRIFEPFFTTKGGAHRGLGLAWVYGIVTNHGGGVAISSTPGEGTAVRVYLPADKRIVKHTPAADSELSGTETILLVDDEELLLTLGQTILSSYGYKVLTADSGPKALEILKTQEPIHLLITDLVMPGMSGRELMEHARQARPAMPVLCTSGYVWQTGQHEDIPYLQKPFNSRDLLSKVKSCLKA